MQEITTVGFVEAQLLMISDLLLSNGLNSKIFIYDNQQRFKSEKHFISQNYELIHDISNRRNFVFGLTNPTGKIKMYEDLLLTPPQFINLFHKSSIISSYSTIGVGVRIEAMSYIGPKVTVGNFVTINRNSSIGHDNKINDFSTINPGVNIAGGVTVGRGSTIGIGTTIINDVNIGNNTIIGAGSLVTHDIPDNVIAYGTPCKVIRKNA